MVTTYQGNTNGSLDGTVLEICQPAVTSGTTAGDVSCLTVATSVTKVTSTDDSSITTDGDGVTIETCGAPVLDI